MAYRLTQEELDQQFEQFLKESVSDDSVDLGSSSKHPSVLDSFGKAPQQQQEKKTQGSVPWWQKDEDCDETQRKVPSKPIPKPRSKVLNKVRHQGKLHLPTQEPSHSTDRQRSLEHIPLKPKVQSSKMSSDSDGRSASEDNTLSGLTGARPDMAENSHSSTKTSSNYPPTENSRSDSWNSSNCTT